jgi:disulfide bond formation protein DsbB
LSEPKQRPALAWAGIALVCAGAIAAALVSQHVFDMQPCPWCVLQRLVFALMELAALAGLTAALLHRRTGQRIAAAGVLMLALAGIAAALWQHFFAASSVSCNLTLADRIMTATGLDALLPEVFAAYASCADAAVKMLGLPYEFWSLALFAMLGAAAVVLGRPSKAGWSLRR